MIKKGRIFIFVLVLLTLLFFSSRTENHKIFAQILPSFPSCVNPATGEILATYSTGTHGVPGDGTTYTGSDIVYKIDQDVILQCLCPINREGIQTNWWKVSDLKENDIKILERQGWILVPNGLAWGLEDSKYLAKNIPFSCKAPIGSQGGAEISGKQQPSRQVLGFASTGNSRIILLIALLGIILVGFGFKINEKKNK